MRERKYILGHVHHFQVRNVLMPSQSPQSLTIQSGQPYVEVDARR